MNLEVKTIQRLTKAKRDEDEKHHTQVVTDNITHCALLVLWEDLGILEKPVYIIIYIYTHTFKNNITKKS